MAVVLGVVAVLALVTLRAADPYPVQVARETTFDLFQQLKPRATPVDAPVAIVDIDEESLRSVGQWPWPRQVMADLADHLFDLGAAVVVFDVLFPEPDRLSPSRTMAGAVDYDAQFAEVLARGQAVLAMSRSGRGEVAPVPKAGFAMAGGDVLPLLPLLDGVAAPLPILAEAVTGLGVASLDREGAGVARRLPLVWSNGTAPLPTLMVEALRVAQGVSTLVLLGNDHAMTELKIGAFDVPTGSSGEMWLYYRPDAEVGAIPAAQVLGSNYQDLGPTIVGKIVLIGTSAAGLLDIRQSALGEAVPGVSIHAQALEQMLTGTFLQRADWVGGIELLAIACVGVLVVVAVVMSGPMVGLFVSLVVALAVAALSWLSFASFGVLLDPSFPLATAFVIYAGMAAFRFAVTDADRRRIRRAFAHYVEPSLLGQIERNADLLKLGGDERELTVMFSDVRNFTALSERHTPAQLVEILNRLFATLGTAIVSRHGTIDKFMGDAVMAFWNAPVDVPHHAREACHAALEMRQALRKLNASTNAEPIAIGIGLSTGTALVGNMGFESRFDYSCVGDTVNVASRVEGACKQVAYDILVTAETMASAPDLAYLFAGAVPLKGLSHSEPLYALVGNETVSQMPAFIQLQAAHQALTQNWTQGDHDDAKFNSCKSLAEIVEPQLARFYDICLSRLADFAVAGSESSDIKRAP